VVISDNPKWSILSTFGNIIEYSGYNLDIDWGISYNDYTTFKSHRFSTLCLFF